MGCIIRLTSNKFLSEFLRDNDYRDFQFILASENITTSKQYKNAMQMTVLIPPPSVITTFLNEGSGKGYEKKYKNYLARPEVESVLSIIVKAAIGGMKVVLLCSKTENEFGYLKLLCDYIEETYKLKTYSYKEYMKDPKKACKIKNHEQVVKILAKSMEKLREVGGENIQADFNVDKYIKKLEKMDKKELRQYCKYKGLKVDDDMGKKEIVKKIKKKIKKSLKKD